jgi:hypothetical protein
MSKNLIAIVAVLTITLSVNVVGLVRIAGPQSVIYAEVVPKDVTCEGCEAFQVQAALARAAAVGRGQILGDGEAKFYWLIAVLLTNIVLHSSRGGSVLVRALSNNESGRADKQRT